MRASVLSLGCVLLALGPGCSLPRDVIGSASGRDAATALDGGGAGVDAAGVDAATGVDAALVRTDAGPRDDAAMPPGDAGGCRHDSDCPADVVTMGACSYASTCATTGSEDQMTTHSTCVRGVCMPQTTTTTLSCSRETDGTSCGAAPTCGACSATACGAMGVASCTGPMCLAGICDVVTTSMPCTTPNDMCGSVSSWGICYYDIGRGRCVQTRSWGACVLGTCAPYTGQSETRDCSC